MTQSYQTSPKSTFEMSSDFPFKDKTPQSIEKCLFLNILCNLLRSKNVLYDT
jgi:hypothetical protein